MKNKIVAYFILGFVGIFSMFLVVSCSNDNNAPIVPNYPPNIFADVSGTYNVHYTGQGKLFITDEPKYGIVITSFYTDSLSRTHYLGLNIYFPKGQLTMGTFPITAQPDTSQIYAAAFYETSSNGAKQTFISYSGEVTVTEIATDKIKATFHFLAKDNKGNSVMVENGSLHITEE